MRTLVLASVCLLGAPASASDLVGSTVPPYPPGLSSSMGSCIADGEEFCAWSIASLDDADQAVVAIAAKQLLERIDGKPVWKIIDVIEAPQTAEGQIWAFEECSVDGTVDPSVIGLVTFRDMGGWIETGETVWAARFDTDAGKIVVPEPSKVRCVLPGS